MTYALLNDKEYYDEMLISALFYSTAYIDDDDRIIVMVDTKAAKEYMVSHNQQIMNFIRKKDDIEFSGMKILVV